MLLLLHQASKNQRRAVLSLAGWLLLLQLPLPVVHCHAESSEHDRVLLRHLERHHATHAHEADHPEDFHFHWLMPWELLDDFSERTSDTPGSTADDSPALASSEVGRCTTSNCMAVKAIGFRETGELYELRGRFRPAIKPGAVGGLSWVQRLAMLGGDAQAILNVVRC